MMQLRAIHRFVTLIIVVFALFLGVTGTAIQTVDLRSIVGRLPATDPNVMAMREAFDGPGNYAVRQVGDYSAPGLPSNFAYPGALATVIRAARADLGTEPFSFVEFRMAGGRPVGQIGLGGGHARFDAASGAFLERTASDPRDNQMPSSTRNSWKHLHRMTTFGNWALIINLVVAVGLLVMIVTGTLLYAKLLKARRKLRKPSLFWSAGGLWRSLHRSISIVAAFFLLVVTLSGGWLAVESASFAINMAMMPRPGAGKAVVGASQLPGGGSPLPLDDHALAGAFATTLAAAQRDLDGAAIVAVRVRNYSGYLQGAVVTGGRDGKQLIYNAITGAPMTETEPGYPKVAFPFGWQAHQTAKAVHRGSYFGMTGRVMDWFAGLAMIYLSVSGIEMYYAIWRKRQRSGRRKLIWK